MKVTIISRETIKPSSQSKILHLKPHKLTLLDQIIPLTYGSCVLFYPNTTHHNDSNFTTIVSKTLTNLKKSLSDTLNFYYPFSGRLKDDMMTVDDFDAGVPFFEARVNCRISDYFNKFNNSESIDKLFPYPPYRRESNEPTPIPLLAVQANIFSCGGIAIGACICHKIGDGSSTAFLLNSWAALSRGSLNEVIKPNFSDVATLFPPVKDFLSEHSVLVDRFWFKDVKSVTKKFIFSAEAVETLREKAAIIGEGLHQKPTRHEAVTCFIWKQLTEATWDVSGSQKVISIGNQLVNMRRNLKIPNAFGNVLWRIAAVANEEGTKVSLELPDLVKKLREAMRDYESLIENIIEEGYGSKLIMSKFEKMVCNVEPSDAKTVDFCFNNLKGFFNDVDFGFGKPYEVGAIGDAGSVSWNTVYLVDSQGGVGIEATIALEEKSLMAVLERDVKFLAFADTCSRISRF